MKCPFCNNLDTKVIDSRYTEDMYVIRRRRECEQCKRRFTTYERADIGLMVIKRDGRIEEFRIDKIIEGIKRATRKRPISVEDIESIALDVERSIREGGLKEIKSEIIGKEVMRRLKRIDAVAYIRFASVYMRFNSVDEFKKVIDEVTCCDETSNCKY